MTYLIRTPSPGQEAKGGGYGTGGNTFYISRVRSCDTVVYTITFLDYWHTHGICGHQVDRKQAKANAGGRASALLQGNDPNVCGCG